MMNYKVAHIEPILELGCIINLTHITPSEKTSFFCIINYMKSHGKSTKFPKFDTQNLKCHQFLKKTPNLDMKSKFYKPNRQKFKCYRVFAHYDDLIWTSQWQFFCIFLRYKKINKIRSIEIIIKRIHLSKAIIINLPKMKKIKSKLWIANK